MPASYVVCLALSLIASLNVWAPVDSPLKFDEFGHLTCKEELARLDNYSTALRKSAGALAVVVVYGGRRDTKQGEVNARLFAIRDRLQKHGAVDSKRIITLNGGFREKLSIQLWMIPIFARDSAHYLAVPTVEAKDVRLKKGVITKWLYKCERHAALSGTS